MRSRHVLCGLGLLCLTTVAQACEQPSLASIPAAPLIGDSSAQIVAATRRYVAGIKSYIACIQAELAAAGGDAAPESLRVALTRRNNAAVEEVGAVVALFTERIAPIGHLYLADFIADAGETCISTFPLETTAVVDDLAVLFIERSGKAYLNVLEAACPNLARYGRFGASRNRIGVRRDLLGGFSEQGPIKTNRLCSDELIYPYAFNTDASPTHECALGQFFELTEEQMQRLGQSRAVVQPPSEPLDDTAETSVPAAGR